MSIIDHRSLSHYITHMQKGSSHTVLYYEGLLNLSNTQTLLDLKCSWAAQLISDWMRIVGGQIVRGERPGSMSAHNLSSY